MAEFQINQATQPAGTPGDARHDLVPSQLITFVATDGATTHTWEIIDKIGSVAVLSSTTGDTIDLGPALNITSPCAFLIQLTSTSGPTTTVIRRIVSVRSPVHSLRIPVFSETAPVTHTLALHDSDLSTDNALYSNLSGLGVSAKNWRGFAEWAYEVVLAVETGGGGSGQTVTSTAGAWTVPAGVVAGDVLYHTGVANSADKASNASLATTPGFGIVMAKPTAVTATIAYSGEVTLVGLVAGAKYYLGVAGAVTTIPPTTPGQVVQRLGIAKNTTILVLNPSPEVLL